MGSYERMHMLTYRERKAAGLRNKDLAAKIGISDTAMSQIRNGIVIPSVARAFAIYDISGEKYGALKNLDATQIVAFRAIAAAQAGVAKL
jgi:transcriptional regulator with XRE-family HTH domain